MAGLTVDTTVVLRVAKWVDCWEHKLVLQKAAQKGRRMVELWAEM